MYVAVIAKFEQLQTTEPQPVNQYTGTEFEIFKHLQNGYRSYNIIIENNYPPRKKCSNNIHKLK